MDIAYYLSELLGEEGRVTIPGLGTFTRQKIAGYYNEQEAKFYPPGSEIIFDQHFTDDDAFAAYVGQQKKISLASSKYFIEKYISKMTTEAMNRDIQFGDLGWIRNGETGIDFIKAGPFVNDPSHYGYPQIEWPKISGTPSPQPTETPAEAPIPGIPAPELKDELVPEAETEDITPADIEQTPVQQEESVKEPLNFGSEMEEYLRELEGGAYIAGPEITTPPPVDERVVEPKPEPAAEEHIPEPVVPETPMDVVLPGHVPEHVISEPVAQETIVVPEPYIPPVAPVTPPKDETHHEEEFVFDGKGYDDVDTRPAERRSYAWLWISLAIVIVLAGVGGFIYYRHQQALLKYQSTAIPLKPVTKPDTSKKGAATDSLDDSTANVKDSAKNGVIKDTTQKAATAPAVTSSGTTTAIDSAKTRYEIIARTARTMAEANIMVTNYKSLGISDAHVLIPGPGMGRILRVSLATYANKIDAINKERELLNTGNVRGIDIIKINPTK